ncbi:MAG: hypothetical protein WDW36_003446 [Sanguina aurantia]
MAAKDDAEAQSLAFNILFGGQLGLQHDLASATSLPESATSFKSTGLAGLQINSPLHRSNSATHSASNLLWRQNSHGSEALEAMLSTIGSPSHSPHLGKLMMPGELQACPALLVGWGGSRQHHRTCLGRFLHRLCEPLRLHPPFLFLSARAATDTPTPPSRSSTQPLGGLEAGDYDAHLQGGSFEESFADSLFPGSHAHSPHRLSANQDNLTDSQGNLYDNGLVKDPQLLGFSGSSSPHAAVDRICASSGRKSPSKLRMTVTNHEASMLEAHPEAPLLQNPQRSMQAAVEAFALQMGGGGGGSVSGDGEDFGSGSLTGYTESPRGSGTQPVSLQQQAMYMAALYSAPSHTSLGSGDSNNGGSALQQQQHMVQQQQQELDHLQQLQQLQSQQQLERQLEGEQQQHTGNHQGRQGLQQLRRQQQQLQQRKEQARQNQAGQNVGAGYGPGEQYPRERLQQQQTQHMQQQQHFERQQQQYKQQLQLQLQQQQQQRLQHQHQGQAYDRHMPGSQHGMQGGFQHAGGLQQQQLQQQQQQVLQQQGVFMVHGVAGGGGAGIGYPGGQVLPPGYSPGYQLYPVGARGVLGPAAAAAAAAGMLHPQGHGGFSGFGGGGATAAEMAVYYTRMAQLATLASAGMTQGGGGGGGNSSYHTPHSAAASPGPLHHSSSGQHQMQHHPHHNQQHPLSRSRGSSSRDLCSAHNHPAPSSNRSSLSGLGFQQYPPSNPHSQHHSSQQQQQQPQYPFPGVGSGGDGGDGCGRHVLAPRPPPGPPAGPAFDTGGSFNVHNNTSSDRNNNSGSGGNSHNHHNNHNNNNGSSSNKNNSNSSGSSGNHNSGSGNDNNNNNNSSGSGGGGTHQHDMMHSRSIVGGGGSGGAGSSRPHGSSTSLSGHSGSHSHPQHSSGGSGGQSTTTSSNPTSSGNRLLGAAATEARGPAGGLGGGGSGGGWGEGGRSGDGGGGRDSGSGVGSGAPARLATSSVQLHLNPYPSYNGQNPAPGSQNQQQHHPQQQQQQQQGLQNGGQQGRRNTGSNSGSEQQQQQQQPHHANNNNQQQQQQQQEQRHLHAGTGPLRGSGAGHAGGLLHGDAGGNMGGGGGGGGGGRARDENPGMRGSLTGGGGGGGAGEGVGRHGGSLLEEFKNNKSRRFELTDIAGHMVEFALDQHGSRFIQLKLESAPASQLGAALDEVLPMATHLMTDVFGNYVMQKFLEHGSPAHRLALASALRGHVLSLSLHMYGCRVVQKALELLPPEPQREMVSELEGHIMRCVRDQNGNHVIQKLIEALPPASLSPLLDHFLECVVPLASHPFGCRVIQRVLEHCREPGRRAAVMANILQSTNALAQDQYGNYVVQHVLEHGTPDERMQLLAHLAPRITTMALHKFASNVVEKCLTHCSAPERDVLIREMLGEGAGGDATSEPREVERSGTPAVGHRPDSDGLAGTGPAGAAAADASADAAAAVASGTVAAAAAAAAARGGAPEGGGLERAEAPRGSRDGEAGAEDPLQAMMKDQFGNYVVQKVLEVCSPAQREQLLGRVRAQLSALKRFTYGKHIVVRVEKLLAAGTRLQASGLGGGGGGAGGRGLAARPPPELPHSSSASSYTHGHFSLTQQTASRDIRPNPYPHHHLAAANPPLTRTLSLPLAPNHSNLSSYSSDPHRLPAESPGTTVLELGWSREGRGAGEKHSAAESPSAGPENPTEKS